jgi:carbon monoxide dehydrogenase subunit G
MHITQEFEVSRPIAAVWDMFQDVPAVAQCLPGAELTESKGDGVYGGKVAVKLGPISATFEGEATIRPDPAAHTATIEGKGVDRRGGSRGQVKVDYSLHATSASQTRVAIEADVTLAGPAAQFGRTGLINEMSNRLIGDFAGCLEAKLSAPDPEAAGAIAAGEVQGLTLFFQSLWAWLRRLFGGK